jgi:hypothetical protein
MYDRKGLVENKYLVVSLKGLGVKPMRKTCLAVNSQSQSNSDFDK